MSWTHAWYLWFHGRQLGPDVRIWHLRLLWWGRAADVVAFVSGLSVAFELLGARPLQALGRWFARRAKRARMMIKYAPVYARRVEAFNDMCFYLACDIAEAMHMNSPPALTAGYEPEPHPVRTAEYRLLAGGIYRELEAHDCGSGRAVLCVHGHELIRDRAGEFLGTSGTPAERVAWRVLGGGWTDATALLVAAGCWLAVSAGAAFAVAAAVRFLPAEWMAAPGLAVACAAAFFVLARRQSNVLLSWLASLGGVEGAHARLMPGRSRTRHHGRAQHEAAPANRLRLWNRPFLYLYGWTGRRYYRFHQTPRHSVTWRTSAIMAEYAVASVVFSVARPIGLMLNRPEPDRLLRWIFLALFVVSFFPFIITQ